MSSWSREMIQRPLILKLVVLAVSGLLATGCISWQSGIFQWRKTDDLPKEAAKPLEDSDQPKVPIMMSGPKSPAGFINVRPNISPDSKPDDSSAPTPPSKKSE